jgi:light-regulated signal transduction histidine kinase (bacteriophytochrome)
MRRQVDYHLTQARATTPGNVPGARCPVLVSVEGLTRTLEKIYAARGLAIEVDVSPAHFIRGQREDLEEMLGNLLDNACKWAKSNVKIQSVQESGAVVLSVDDDGPGLPPCTRDQVLQRGVRADEGRPRFGTGIGNRSRSCPTLRGDDHVGRLACGRSAREPPVTLLNAWHKDLLKPKRSDSRNAFIFFRKSISVR